MNHDLPRMSGDKMVDPKDTERETTLIGDRFPHMEVWTTHGKMTLPEDMAGKWFISVQPPRDFTPVCTTEFYSFTKMSDDFKDSTPS